MRGSGPAGIAVLAMGALIVALGLAGCGGPGSVTTAVPETPRIVVTTPLLGSVVREAVGDSAVVDVVMPNGADPHEWHPSATAVAALHDADLIVENGLGLESWLTEAIAQAKADGVPVFTATDHVDVLTVTEGMGPTDDDHAVGTADPHFWTDPSQMRAVVLALPAAVRAAMGLDVSAQAQATAADLASLDTRTATMLASVPPAARGIVTGHDSLGYLARRNDYTLVGAVTPSLSSQGQVSAAHLAALEAAMRTAGVRVIFTETGTPRQVITAIADETGATVVDLGTEALPPDGSYDTFMSEIARRIASALGNTGG
ncbi:MAG: zinc ABC transporter substrate-binding protein [Thermoleophilia bacterium]|nr:zinc ABC transporter substrate-binding protein [Thermoleophilia bacterium]